ncbi:MAG: O-antigen ligase family protein [Phycisphaerae bacterium]
MPKSMFGIQGLNMWNILLVGVFAGWLASRRREGLTWDMPRHINALLLLYLGVILVGFLRALLDRSHLENYTVLEMISEELINTIKWVVPGLLLFDGCRSRKRLQWAVVSILGMYFLLAAQVVARVPWQSALGGSEERIDYIRAKLCSDIGYSRCDMSTFLAGASWAMLAAIPLARHKKFRFLLLGAAGIGAFGQALTGGRAGYVAWMATGLVLCIVKWRKYLLLAPAVPLVLMIAFPGVIQRTLEGFRQTDAAGQTVVDDYLVTSGRTLIWPHVVDRISESSACGYGRLAMRRTGLADYLEGQYGEGEGFPHPHNMYLEILLDNGIIGAIPILLFFGLIVVYAGRLFRAADPWCSAVGGLALSMVLAQLFAGIGSQHFYPEESKVGMWAAVFLMLRVSVIRARVSASATAGLANARLHCVPAAGLEATS